MKQKITRNLHSRPLHPTLWFIYTVHII